MTRTRTPARNSFLADIITTAVEGGIGYWSIALEYRWNDPGLPEVCQRLEAAPGGGGNAYALIIDTETDQRHEITLDVAARGLRRIIEGRTNSTDRDVAIVRAADHANDLAPENGHGDIDAWIADQIIQAGLLGDIIYA